MKKYSADDIITQKSLVQEKEESQPKALNEKQLQQINEFN